MTFASFKPKLFIDKTELTLTRPTISMGRSRLMRMVVCMIWRMVIKTRGVLTMKYCTWIMSMNMWSWV
jgi:hypothetical protein